MSSTSTTMDIEIDIKLLTAGYDASSTVSVYTARSSINSIKLTHFYLFIFSR